MPGAGAGAGADAVAEKIPPAAARAAPAAAPGVVATDDEADVDEAKSNDSARAGMCGVVAVVGDSADGFPGLAGWGPKAGFRARSKAAPVGVTSSFSRCAE